jgi:hypothetical protein
MQRIPRGLKRPPTETKTQRLPFEEIEWHEFEDLCRRLAQAESAPGIEVRPYGNPGQDQQGIDLVTKRRSENRDTVYQCKKVEKYTAADIREAVDKFLKGDFKDTSCRFVLCCTQPLTDTKQVDEIRAQRDRLHPIEFEVWDQVQLSEKLKHQHAVVEDFFSLRLAQLFCLSENHGLPDFATARTKLRAIFSTLDFAGVGVVQEGGPQSRVESVSLNDAYYELKFQRESQQKEKPVFLLPEDLFGKPKSRHLVRGRGGSGKTTWLRRTFNRLVEDDRYFPLLIELRQLARTWESGKSSLETYLRQWLKDYEVGNRDDILKHLFENNDAPIPVLLVDGWDELGGLGTDVRARLMGLLNTCHRAQVIVTSRPYGEDRPTEGDGFTRWDLAPLTKEDMHAFSQHFYQACYPSDGPRAKEYDTKFREALDRSPNAAQLGEVPLLLVMMLMISRTEVLPDKRHKLYERCITNLLEAIPKFQEGQGVRQHAQEWRPDDTEERMRVVSELAFRMKSEVKAASDGAIRVNWQTALSYLPTDWKATQRDGFLYWLCSRAGLLVDDPKDNSTQFAHLSFQEYLAAHHAEAVKEGPDRITFALETVKDQTWWETLRLWAAKVNGKNPRNWKPVMEALISQADEQTLGLAGAILADGAGWELASHWAEGIARSLSHRWDYAFYYCAQAIATSCNRVDLDAVVLSEFHRKASEPGLTVFQWIRLNDWLASSSLSRLKTQPSIPMARHFLAAVQAVGHTLNTVAVGRVCIGFTTCWGGEPIALLHAWPSRRRLFGLKLQNWMLHTNDPKLPPDWLRQFWSRSSSVDELRRALVLADGWARYWASDLPYQWARALTDGWAGIFAADWAPYFDHNFPPEMASSWYSSFARAYAYESNHLWDSHWTRTWTSRLASDMTSSLARDIGGGSSSTLARILARSWNLQEYGEFGKSFAFSEFARSFGRRTMQSQLKHYDISPNTPELVRLLQLSARGQDAWETATTDIHPIWPAFGHHLARRSTPEEKALLESYAKDPDSANDPQLALGLRFIVRGDIMLPDGTFKTLDEIADEHGLPRLPFLEEVPEPFAVE